MRMSSSNRRTGYREKEHLYFGDLDDVKKYPKLGHTVQISSWQKPKTNAKQLENVYILATEIENLALSYIYCIYLCACMPECT